MKVKGENLHLCGGTIELLTEKKMIHTQRLKQLKYFDSSKGVYFTQVTTVVYLY